MEDLMFVQSPKVRFATNTFIDVPIILQYEKTPLIEVVKLEKAGYTTQIPIYGQDGTYLAKVVGSRLLTTSSGEKAGLTLRYPKNMTVCELNGKIVFEIHRTDAAALNTWAELYTPDGAFVKCPPDIMPQLFIGSIEHPLKIRGVIMQNNIFSGLRIGILVKSNGSLSIGVN